ncbi:LAQU0S01e01904g1_1 [Lachancea quebecensis]|uniref:Ornithine decarboxylase n=1 Tax=Lachancea quebecensis TaxID=1654605 RepID=A0A0P1KMC5_9SACH|nr:LAQU0S01e01904g1_1 [Lachancea quebecensis]
MSTLQDVRTLISAEKSYETDILSNQGATTKPCNVADSKGKSIKLAHESICKTLSTRVQSINQEVCEAGDENSFFVCDLGEVKRLYEHWRTMLPRVHPFYAVKSNPDRKVLETLAKLDVNFDCASKSEIEMVLNLGVEPSRIIYANPCKASSFIRYAKNSDVRKSTFDNVEELAKIKKYHPESELLLRIATDDSTAQCRLSTKYGCEMEGVGSLLAKVKELNLNLVGVSFHIGSGASDFGSFYKAVRDARQVFDLALERFGLQNVHILDIGGGFQLDSFTESSAVLNAALEEFFPPGTGVDVIAEPGRFFAASPFTLACHVIAKRAHDEKESMLYINDGVYGNMNCILFDHQKPTPRVLHHNKQFHYWDFESSSPTATAQCQHKVSIWGPTCDGLDCITNEYYLKHDLVVGDWLYFPVLGAYTSSAATQFNGFEQVADVIYIDSSSQ